MVIPINRPRVSFQTVYLAAWKHWQATKAQQLTKHTMALQLWPHKTMDHLLQLSWIHGILDKLIHIQRLLCQVGLILKLSKSKPINQPCPEDVTLWFQSVSQPQDSFVSIISINQKSWEIQFFCELDSAMWPQEWQQLDLESGNHIG